MVRTYRTTSDIDGSLDGSMVHMWAHKIFWEVSDDGIVHQIAYNVTNGNSPAHVKDCNKSLAI